MGSSVPSFDPLSAVDQAHRARALTDAQRALCREALPGCDCCTCVSELLRDLARRGATQHDPLPIALLRLQAWGTSEGPAQ